MKLPYDNPDPLSTYWIDSREYEDPNRNPARNCSRLSVTSTDVGLRSDDRQSHGVVVCVEQ